MDLLIGTIGIIVIVAIIYGLTKLVSTAKKTAAQAKLPQHVIDEAFGRVFKQLTSGEGKRLFSTNLMLKKAEMLVFDISGVQYCEERTTKYKGRSRGISIRIMKGVYYRMGSGEAEAVTKVVPLDTGNLALTNKRIVYYGATKSVDYPLSKIVSVDPLDDGVAINRTGKSKIEYFVGTNETSLNVGVSRDAQGEGKELKGTLSYHFDGKTIRALIEHMVTH